MHIPQPLAQAKFDRLLSVFRRPRGWCLPRTFVVCRGILRQVSFLGASMAGGMPAAERIRFRANEVATPREYICFFEWIAFCAHWQKRVLVLFGEAFTDVLDVFFADHLDRFGLGAAEWPVSCVVACQSVGGILRDASGWGGHNANHFVMAIPREGHMRPLAPREAALRSDKASGQVEATCARLGYMVMSTVSNGDCGIDCMSVILNRHRPPRFFDGLRCQLAKYMTSVADDEQWQDAFGACQEHMPMPGPRKWVSLAKERSALDLTISLSGNVPSAAQPGQAPTSASKPGSDEADKASKPILPPPLPPPADPPPLPPPADPLPVPGSASGPPSPENRSGTFLEYLRDLPKGERDGTFGG